AQERRTRAEASHYHPEGPRSLLAKKNNNPITIESSLDRVFASRRATNSAMHSSGMICRPKPYAQHFSDHGSVRHSPVIWGTKKCLHRSPQESACSVHAGKSPET